MERKCDEKSFSFSDKTPESSDFPAQQEYIYEFNFSFVRTCYVFLKLHSLALNELFSDLKKTTKQCHNGGMRSLTHNEHSCLAASFLCTTAYFLLKKKKKTRGCPASCTYYTKPMTTNSPNSTVGACLCQNDTSQRLTAQC